MNPDPVPTRGHTRDAGWQIGVSKTVDHPLDQVWDFLTSPAGTAIWLGHGAAVLEERGAPFETDDGTVGQTRSYRNKDKIRLTWRPVSSDHDTIVQIALRSSGPSRTMLRFHQDRMVDASEREEQRRHWQAVMACVVHALDH